MSRDIHAVVRQRQRQNTSIDHHFHVEETSGTKWRIKMASAICAWYSKDKRCENNCTHMSTPCVDS